MFVLIHILLDALGIGNTSSYGTHWPEGYTTVYRSSLATPLDTHRTRASSILTLFMILTSSPVWPSSRSSGSIYARYSLAVRHLRGQAVHVSAGHRRRWFVQLRSGPDAKHPSDFGGSPTLKPHNRNPRLPPGRPFPTFSTYIHLSRTFLILS